MIFFGALMISIGAMFVMDMIAEEKKRSGRR